MLYGFQYCCIILCGLVWDYGSTVIQRSSWSLCGFGASLPIAWSHPTFVRYKASCPAVRSKLSLICDLLSWKLGHPQGGSLSSGIKAFIVMVGLTIIHIFTFDLSIFCYCFCSSPKVHWKSHTKNPIAFWRYYYLCVVVFIKLLVTIFVYFALCFVCYPHPC
jgi:hypothetical protein